MLSRGDQIGFEATIIRPDGTKFNEYEVKHYNDKKGRAVTECWLESENDAVYKIKIEKRKREMTRFKSSSWEADCLVDGRILEGSVWHHPSDSHIMRKIIRKSEHNEYFMGDLTFAPADTTPLQELATIKPGAMRAIASIAVHLRPAKFTCSGVSPTDAVSPIGILHEGAAKLAMVTKSTNERPAEAIGKTYDAWFEHPNRWQIFIFKYRHRVTLENMGVIERPLPSPSPSPGNTTRRKRAREVDVNEDRKPDIQQLGGQDPVADLVEVVPDMLGPLREQSSNSEVNDVTQDRQRPAAGLSADAGADIGARPQRSEEQPAAANGTDVGPTHAVQDPVIVEQALAWLSVDPELAKDDQGRRHIRRLDTTEETKPEINAAAGPSSMAVSRLPNHGEESDADDQENSGEEERDMWWEIEMHQKAIERLQRGIKEKGKGNKRAKLERGASVKVEEGQRSVKARRDEPIDLSIDSD